MTVKRSILAVTFALACIAALPSAAWAQSVITGIVRDTSGAVMPGVTVEAASPVLIEKVRMATTDGTGQYRIEQLRTGTYTVTFSLPGFTTVSATIELAQRRGGKDEIGIRRVHCDEVDRALNFAR